MGPAREASGGSAANTVAGLASLGLRAAFIGQLADDQLGQIFAHDIRSLGVEFGTPPKDGDRRHRALPDPGHARRPADDEHLSRRRANARAGRGRGSARRGREDPLPRRLSVGPGRARAPRCTRRWTPRARRAPRSPSLCPTVSSSTATAATCCGCSTSGGSTSCSPTRPRCCSSPSAGDIESARRRARAARSPTLVVTRGEKGAVARRGGEFAPGSGRGRSPRLVDTTGAGDLFAAGFLAGEARGLGLEQSLKLGAICAAEVIQHYGARPEADLRALAGALLA